MALGDDNLRPWEQEGRILLAPLKENEPKARSALKEATVRRLYALMTIRDFIEFSTVVAVREHLLPSFGALASLFRNQHEGRKNRD